MIIYFLIFAFISTSFLIERGSRNLYISISFSFIVALVLAFYAGLRAPDTGEDYGSYKLIFDSFDGITLGGISQVISFDYFFEPGFAFYIVFIKTFTYSYELFLFITALITCFVFFNASIKLTSLFLATWLIYFSYFFFTHGLVAIRFGLASCIALYAVCHLSVLNRGKAAIIASLAMLFHTSAIAIFLPILLSYVKVNRSKIVFLLFLSFCVGFLSLGEDIVRFILPSWLPRADSALNYIQSSQYGETLGFLGFINIKNLILSLLFLFSWKTLIARYEHARCLMLFFFVGTAIRLGFHDLGFIIGRISAILTFTEVFIFPMLAFSIFRFKVFAWLLVCAYSLFNLASMLFARGFGEYNSVIFQ